DHNEAHGGNGNTGTGFLIIGMAAGAGIANSGVPTQAAVMIADNVTLRDNLAVGGTGNTPGPFGGICFGARLIHILGTTVTLSNSRMVGNQAFGGLGGAGDNGRDALGGGVANMLGGTLTVSDSTLADNQAVGGAGEAGGNGLGGGIFNDGPSIDPLNLGSPARLTVLNSTLTHNEARGGPPGALCRRACPRARGRTSTPGP